MLISEILEMFLEVQTVAQKTEVCYQIVNWTKLSFVSVAVLENTSN